MLKKGIESALALAYQPIEILVVDNSPSDEIFQWLQDAFPMVKTIKTFAPLPLPMVRNMLVATAKGKYVIFHDDDSRFAESLGVSAAVSYLEERSEVACLAFRQGNERGEWNPLFDGPAVCTTYNYIACAVMFRRTDYFEAGGYFEQFPLYGEEMILSLGFFGLGKEIHYYPHVEIIHEQTAQGRAKDAGKRYHLADIAMTPGAMLLRAPAPDVFIHYPLSLFRAVSNVALIKRRPLVALQGLLKAIFWIPAFLRARRPIPPLEFRRWLRTRQQSRQSTQARISSSLSLST